MPTVSMFYGIIIRMYYAPKEHNPPHIHAYYQNETAVITIRDCEVTQSNFKKRQLRIVKAWIELHRDELLANWSLCQNGEPPYSIEPLK